MRVVLQRVNKAILTSDDFRSEIGFGLLVTVGVNVNDTIHDVKYLAKKIANLRIFKDENNKCNLSLLNVNGEIMVVSNFTLQATIKSGTRPDFSKAGDGEKAYEIYNSLVKEFESLGCKNVEIGNFGHHMHIDCELDGPLNIILESEGRGNE